MVTARRLQRIQTVYEARTRIPFDGTTVRDEIERDVRFLEGISFNKSATICDIGCGRGWHLDALRSRDFTRVLGLDLCLGGLSLARKRLRDARLAAGNIFDSPLKCGFDVVSAFYSCLGAFSAEGDKAYCSCLAKLLKPGGLLILGAFVAENAARLVGRFTRSYSTSQEVEVASDVRCRTLGGREYVTIRQSASGVPSASSTEVLRLYSSGEIKSLLLSAGFSQVSFDRSCALFGARK